MGSLRGRVVVSFRLVQRAGGADRTAAAVLLLRRLHRGLRRGSHIGPAHSRGRAPVARQHRRRLGACAPHGLRRRPDGRRRHRRAGRAVTLPVLARRGGGGIRAGPGARTGRVRADLASAGRVLGQRGPGLRRRRLCRRRRNRLAADRRESRRGPERGRLSPHPRQSGRGRHAHRNGRGHVHPGRHHGAQGQGLDRAARPGPAGCAGRRRDAAGQARVTVGPLALPGLPGQAGPRPQPGTPAARASDPREEPRPGPADRPAGPACRAAR